MNTKTKMLEQLDAVPHGFSLPQAFYTDPDYYQVDLQEVFYREWLFAGHDCEIPTPGSYFTLQIGAYPVVVVRGKEGNIQAFHNVCRHRGSRVCKAEKGKSAKLVCPYHQWTYELDGKLLFARDMGADFDKKNYGLKPIHCESIGGYIFISLAETAPDFSPVRNHVAPYLVPHNLADAKVAFESTIVEKGNWKLVWENNRECYHCVGSHPELCRTFPETPTVTSVHGAESNPLLAAHWRRCEAAGLPSAFHLSQDGQYRTSRVPLLKDASSYTMDGTAAVSKPLTELGIGNIGALLLFHYPTTWNHVLGDHAISFRVLPLGPMETQVTTKWLVNKDAKEGVDYTIEELTRVWTATNDQDRRIVEENQLGIRSPSYQPGPYNQLHEGGVIQFVNWYRRCLGQNASASSSPLSRVA